MNRYPEIFEAAREALEPQSIMFEEKEDKTDKVKYIEYRIYHEFESKRTTEEFIRSLVDKSGGRVLFVVRHWTMLPETEGIVRYASKEAEEAALEERGMPIEWVFEELKHERIYTIPKRLDTMRRRLGLKAEILKVVLYVDAGDMYVPVDSLYILIKKRTK